MSTSADSRTALRSAAADRARAMVELNALERSMRTLLSMVEARATDVDGLARATEEYASRLVDPVALVERFRDAGPAERELFRRRLIRLADLDAVLRAACGSELVSTAAAIRRARSVRVQFEALGSVESAGDAVDCVR